MTAPAGVVASTLLAVVLGSSRPAAADPAAASPSSTSPQERELNLVPLVGGDSDVGIGFGEVGDWARLQPNGGVYRWRLENAAFISFKLREGGIVVPFQDYYLLYTRRNEGAEKRWVLDVRLSFTDETTLKFYGFGNASPPPPSGIEVADTEFGRIHPTFSVAWRRHLGGHFYAKAGSVYTHNWLSVHPSSTLAAAAGPTSPDEVRALVGSFRPHGVELLEAGLEYDTRDNEIVTHDGAYHTAQIRVSPKIGSWLPYPYVQLDTTLRFYATLVPRWLTLAARGVGDVLLGDPPFYELARFEETAAIGGTKAIRGVPAQRYYGKVKLFGNIELRSELFPFRLRSKPFVLGVAAFADGGRVWTELTRAHPELDGSGLGLKYGLGGGLRLQEGQTFVVRADIAWSPDATPVGAYFAAGQIF